MSLEKSKSLTASRSNAMKPSELEAFLAEPREARLATTRTDSSVHLTPVWFIADGTVLSFCLEAERLHLKNLRRTPQATLLIDEDQRPGNDWHAPVRGVMCAGTVQLLDDDPTCVEKMRIRILRRYLGGSDDDPSFPEMHRDPSKQFTLAVLRPSRILSWDFGKG